MSLTLSSKRVTCVIVGILFFCTAGAATGTNDALSKEATFESELSSITDSPPYANASWGIILVDPSTGRTLFEKNGNEMFIPASTTKLFSSAALLKVLGPDYRFKTPVYAIGSSSGEHGGKDLILVASGDPNMGGRTRSDGTIEFTNTDHTDSNGQLTRTNPLAGLDELAGQAKESGITTVSEVIIDDRLFENVHREYMDILSPIVINDNRIDISITPGKEGSAPAIGIRPETSAYRLENQAVTGPAGSPLTIVPEEQSPGIIVVSGSVASDAGMINTTFSDPDPASFARTLFIEALNRQGIKVSADPSKTNPGDTLPSAGSYDPSQKVAELVSPPLSEEVKLTLKVSQNMHANQYIMLLALAENKTGYDEGIIILGEQLRDLGLDTSVMALGDGAGGDRVNRVSPGTVASLLALVEKQPFADAYIKAQPILGVDGTTFNHCRTGNPGCGHVYAKTGTMEWPDFLNQENILLSKGLAGYIDARSGKRLVFCTFVNNVPLLGGTTADTVGTDLGSIAGLMYEYF